MFFFRLIFKRFYRFLSDKNYRTFHKLSYQLGGRQRYKEVKVKLGSWQLIVPDSLSFVWQYYEIFVEHFYRFTTSKETPLIYDCGANIGLSVLYFKSIFPSAKIKAFEADPEIATYFKRNMKENAITGVELVIKAVWIDNYGINIVSEGSDGASVFIEGVSNRVPSLNLKEELAREREVDMLKMDIEGAETKVLLACESELPKIKNLFIEYHSYRKYPQELASLLALLERTGFRYYIQSPAVRPMPLVYKFERKIVEMDLQVNIFAYKTVS